MGALGALLADPSPDPFAAEVIAVPTRGMERWLTQQLSARLGASTGRRDGVCANVAFPSPHRLARDAVAAASGVEPDEDPWLPERMVWALLEVVDSCLGEPWLHSLSRHLGGPAETSEPSRRARRLSAVRHIAELLDRYALHRPEMVLGWIAGRDTGGSDRTPAYSAWQAELWRRLRERIGQPSPAERAEGACAQLRDDPGLVALPRRIALFGLTRMPAGHLLVVQALAAQRDAHLFLLHPSPALWERVVNALEGRPPIIRRSDDLTEALVANRLLASWGHDAREMQLTLGATDQCIDHHHPVAGEPESLLERIQADVLADRPPAGVPYPGEADARPPLGRGDRSVQVHACHGRARQVEVLRDTILHLLQEDPTLEPRDIIVMCPDVETFAPLVHATFGGHQTESDELETKPADLAGPDLRVRLADRSLRQTNPLLAVVAALFELAGQRLTASQVLDLADREPVRRRFRLDDDDLARIQDWVTSSGIRWGLDAAHRAPFKLDGVGAGTWRAGLDRLLCGVTMTEDEQRLLAGVLPLDDVDSGAIDLAGRLAELLDRLTASLDALSTSKTIDAWAAAIAGAADALTASSPYEAWQRSELDRLLDDVVTEATVGGAVNPTELAPAEVRALLEERLRGRPTRVNFRTGHLTICTLVPMRSVPHRVVCLLGLDDGAFPRKAPRDGDDLMLADPHVGDRDPRTEDRQLLLDALMAATDRLVITYTGNDERTNTPVPAAVPVSELLDIVDATVRQGSGPARARVVVRHPLQPFDPRNFAAEGVVPDRVWSFDRIALAGARALSAPRAQAPPFLSQPLDPTPVRLVEVDQLVRFAQHPVRAFLRQRLGISVADFSAEVDDGMPAELDALEKWGVGQRLLDARLDGVEERPAALAEIARGTLPPGVLGRPVITDIVPNVEEIVRQVQQRVAGGAAPESIDVRIALDDERSIGGSVAGVSGDLLLAAAYSRVGPKHRLAAWVRLVALTAAHPERAFEAATIGRATRGQGVTIARIAPLSADAGSRREVAMGHLAALLDLYDRGMCEPLPLYCASSAAYAAAAAAGRNAVKEAQAQWESEWNFEHEDKELEHQLVLGGVSTFEALLGEPPRPGEDGGGWQRGESTRFGRLARRMWDGLLAHEELTRA